MNDADLQEFDVVRRVAQGVADAVEEERGTPTAIENSMYAYAAVYNIAVRGLDRDPDGLYATQRHLYDAFQDLLSELVTRRPLDLGAPREELFHAVVRKWRHFKLLERWMLVAFKYISTHYVPHYSRRPLDFVALSIFYQCVFQPAAAAVTDVMLEYVAAERQGVTTRRSTMRDAVGMLAHMGFDDRMPPDFVQALLVATTEYYRAASADLIEREVDSVEYCQTCQKWLRAERELAGWLLPDSKMQQELLAVAEHELLAQHSSFILENPHGSGFVALLAAAGKTPTPELTCMVELMVRPAAASVDEMARLLGSVCRADGEAINARFAARDAEVDARGFVQAFTELHDRYVALGATVLNHAQFTRTIRSAFERTVNAGVSCTIRGATRVVPGPELIAQCCDVLLRSPSLSDDALDAQFNAIVSLFARISDKDGFLEVMHVCLSRRLLSGGEGDLEREKALIGKLKEHGGASATSKMESMLRDVEAAKVLDLEYENSTQRASLPSSTTDIDFSVLLVRTGVWPKLRSDPLRLPLSVAGHAVAFEMMYLAKENHARREIDWSHNYGHAVLTTTFTPTRYELRMTAPQAVVVLCFNDRTTWRTVEVARECEMSEEETRRAVHPFLKLRLLTRAPGAGPSEEALTLNPQFTAPTRKVRVPIAMPRLVAPEASGAAAAAAAASSGDARKRPVIEACIMRVMKARQTLEHHALLDTVREHLSRRFEPDPRMMKTVLDMLIDRDFLRRDEASPNVYHFVA